MKSWFGKVLQWETVQYQDRLKKGWKTIQMSFKVSPKLEGFWQNLTTCFAVFIQHLL